ncbi:unnamed protein product [marine sediment metagenome]|uniref:Beta-galactosidase n=1 Tax=marine sediment metagenome TaxID=412755 RepID=X1DD92_9ZZZZ
MKNLIFTKIVFTRILMSITASVAVSGCSLADWPETKLQRRVSFNDGWKSLKQEIYSDGIDDIEKSSFDDSGWRILELPHDWGIEGPFTEGPFTEEVESAEGCLPFPGVGWYRKTFESPPQGKHVFIQFDGVMKNA